MPDITLDSEHVKFTPPAPALDHKRGGAESGRTEPGTARSRAAGRPGEAGLHGGRRAPGSPRRMSFGGPRGQASCPSPPLAALGLQPPAAPRSSLSACVPVPGLPCYLPTREAKGARLLAGEAASSPCAGPPGSVLRCSPEGAGPAATACPPRDCLPTIGAGALRIELLLRPARTLGELARGGTGRRMMDWGGMFILAPELWARSMAHDKPERGGGLYKSKVSQTHNQDSVKVSPKVTEMKTAEEPAPNLGQTLEWLRKELSEMQIQDQRLLLTLRHLHSVLEELRADSAQWEEARSSGGTSPIRARAGSEGRGCQPVSSRGLAQLLRGEDSRRSSLP
ncbi:PREDICTED: uncharacterized protein C20orf202 homolog [Galeopterus variegatus]|uniref:Uncharacterized protein C20orf202 homolog n=1 Tax=Galeopterus variegatus TaxID=482537 RepID=A0ABM0RK33_GALVR|nr:PREDICTED: uncharacterized protein C20orf202 homolog [Galeopterus variegatus]